MIRGNGGYHSPELAQAAQNIAQMFGPPSAAELAGYSSARKNNQEVEHKARLAQIALDPNSSWAQIDRAGLGLGGWVPTQSFEGIDRNNATQRYGYDTQAATQRANNLKDNQFDFLIERFGTADPYHTAPALPGDIAAQFEMPELAARVGAPKPLSMTEWTAQQAERMRGVEGGVTDDDIKSLIMKDANGSAAQERINRIAQNLISTKTVADPKVANDLANGIVDGRLQESRHPITGELQIIDMATGKPATWLLAPPAPAPSAEDQMIGLITGDDPFGPQYPAANQSFGVGGALTGAINQVSDTLGFGVPYPAVQQTQAAFGVLRENLLNGIAETYGRQPPSWLLQEIRGLTPEAGSPFEGGGAAQAKLMAIGRQLNNQIAQTQDALGRENSPTSQQELQTRLGGLQVGVRQVQEALAAFGPQNNGQKPDADGWVTLPNGVRIREIQ